MFRNIFAINTFLTEYSLIMREIRSVNSTIIRQVQSTCVNLKSKSKKFEKKGKIPSLTDLDLSSEIQDNIGLTSFGEEANDSLHKMHHILRQRIATKITPSHLDAVQLESISGFVPLKLVSQLSFPKPNFIRLDMSQSREHVQNAVKALKHYFPFAGIQTQGFDSIEITTFKLNKVIKSEMVRDAKRCCQDTKSIIKNISAPILKKLKSQRSLPADTKYEADNFIQNLIQYYIQQVDESIDKKLEDINEL